MDEITIYAGIMLCIIILVFSLLLLFIIFIQIVRLIIYIKSEYFDEFNSYGDTWT